MVFVAQVESHEVMRMVVQVGNHGPIHATGVGKALLAHMPEKQASELFKNADTPELTKNTLTTLKNFLPELKKIRKQGFASEKNSEDNPGFDQLRKYQKASCLLNPISKISLSPF